MSENDYIDSYSHAPTAEDRMGRCALIAVTGVGLLVSLGILLALL